MVAPDASASVLMKLRNEDVWLLFKNSVETAAPPTLNIVAVDPSGRLLVMASSMMEIPVVSREDGSTPARVNWALNLVSTVATGGGKIGKTVGVMLGDRDGETNGELLGLKEGETEGELLGLAMGLADGLIDRMAEGEALGDADGSLVVS